MGRFDEALVEIQRAQNLDPLSFIANTVAGCMFFFSRRYDRAMDRKTLALDPNSGLAHYGLGRTYIQKSKNLCGP